MSTDRYLKKTEQLVLKVSLLSFHMLPEVIATINGWKLAKAYGYLEQVQERKQCIPFRRFNGGVGRTPQASAFGTTQGELTF